MSDSIKKYFNKENVAKGIDIAAGIVASIYNSRRPTSLWDIFGTTSSSTYPYRSGYGTKTYNEIVAEENKQKSDLKRRELEMKHEKEMLELKLKAREAGINLDENDQPETKES
jgi:hypothetical protein